MYVVFFKTEDQSKSRMSFVIEKDSIDDAILYREKLITEGFDGKKVIYTSIKEGQV
jgi:hypothetical protein